MLYCEFVVLQHFKIINFKQIFKIWPKPGKLGFTPWFLPDAAKDTVESIPEKIKCMYLKAEHSKLEELELVNLSSEDTLKYIHKQINFWRRHLKWEMIIFIET